MEAAFGSFNSTFFDEYQNELANTTAALDTLVKHSNEINLTKGAFDTQQLQNGVPGATDAQSNAINAINAMSSITTSIQEASQQLENGEISVSEYFHSYTEAFGDSNIQQIFSDIKNGASDLSTDMQKAMLEVSESLVDGLSDGLSQANKQLKNGQISLTDYNALLIESAEAGLDCGGAIQGISTDGKEWSDILKEIDGNTSTLTDDQKA